MPIYEYRCRGCDETVERLQKPGEAPGECPSCGGELRRLWGNVSVRFSGWGFSKTDDLLPEGRRASRDFDEVKRKAEELTDSD